MLWTNEISRDMCLRLVSYGYPTLHSAPDSEPPRETRHIAGTSNQFVRYIYIFFKICFIIQCHCIIMLASSMLYSNQFQWGQVWHGVVISHPILRWPDSKLKSKHFCNITRMNSLRQKRGIEARVDSRLSRAVCNGFMYYSASFCLW